MTVKREVPSWEEYFFGMAQLVKKKSKDRSTQVGVVVTDQYNRIVTTGYNGFPPEIDDNYEPFHLRPTKYFITEHAERNAIYFCARKGISLEGCRMYFNSNPFPCSDCARAILLSGIKTVIGKDVKFEGKGDWLDSLWYGKEMLLSSGVDIILIDDNGQKVNVKNAKQFQGYSPPVV